MTSRAVRLTLFGVFALLLAGSTYLFFITQQKAKTDGTAARAMDQRARSLTRTIHDLKSAQQAYVATGQGDEFWIQKTSALLATAHEQLAGVGAAAAAPSARVAVEEANAHLQDFEQMDRRARDYTRNGQRLLASDLIFSEGLEKTDAILAAIDRARDAELSEHERAAAFAQQRQYAAAGATGLVGLLLMGLLVRIPRVKTDESETLAAAPSASPGLGLDREARRWDEAPAVAPTPAIDLPQMAALCTELARVNDTRGLPALLERAAAVLEATGIIVWIADPDGRELNPIVTHGYSPQLVTRLGTIPRDAENATAAAFRTSLLQTVKADAVSNGAIAAPLLTPAGCVGVMAAEVRRDGEQEEAKRAAATIVAAQLATLVGPPSARSKVEAAGA